MDSGLHRGAEDKEGGREGGKEGGSEGGSERGSEGGKEGGGQGQRQGHQFLDKSTFLKGNCTFPRQMYVFQGKQVFFKADRHKYVQTHLHTHLFFILNFA